MLCVFIATVSVTTQKKGLIQKNLFRFIHSIEFTFEDIDLSICRHPNLAIYIYDSDPNQTNTEQCRKNDRKLIYARQHSQTCMQYKMKNYKLEAQINNFCVQSLKLSILAIIRFFHLKVKNCKICKLT